MEREELTRKITNEVIRKLAEKKRFFVPAAASNRHIHVSQVDLDELFGRGYMLQEFRKLSQLGQFACSESVIIEGAKGRFEHVRILGPVRSQTQVEVSLTDTYILGVEPTVRMSGDIANTPGCRVIGPAGEIELKEGVIVASRHLHISCEEAKLFGLNNDDIVSVKKTGSREITFGNVVVRVSPTFSIELHLDTDEANAAQIKNGDLLQLIKDYDNH